MDEKKERRKKISQNPLKGEPYIPIRDNIGSKEGQRKTSRIAGRIIFRRDYEGRSSERR